MGMQFVHPKPAVYDVAMSFELIICDFMETFPIAAIERYTYVSRVTDGYNRWKAVYFLNACATPWLRSGCSSKR